MSCIGPDVAPCFSPVAGERQKPYQWCLDLRGICIDFQGGGLVRGASEHDSGVLEPRFCWLSQGEIFLYIPLPRSCTRHQSARLMLSLTSRWKVIDLELWIVLSILEVHSVEMAVLILKFLEE